MNRNIVTANDASQLKVAAKAGKFDDLGGGEGEGVSTPAADDFTSRLMKLVPIEVIGTYLAATALLDPVPNTTNRKIVMWIVFGVMLVMTPLYLRRQAKVIRKKQLGVSAAAFAVWAFALGGPFQLAWSGYEVWMGGIAVILFTFVLSGLGFAPIPEAKLAKAL
jgi:hypothetical protein